MVQQVGLKQGLLNELLKWILYFRGSQWIEATIHDEMWCRFRFSNNNNKINIGGKKNPNNSLMLIRGHSNMNFGDPGPKSSGSTLWCLPTSLNYRQSLQAEFRCSLRQRAAQLHWQTFRCRRAPQSQLLWSLVGHNISFSFQILFYKAAYPWGSSPHCGQSTQLACTCERQQRAWAHSRSPQENATLFE